MMLFVIYVLLVVGVFGLAHEIKQAKKEIIAEIKRLKK